MYSIVDYADLHPGLDFDAEHYHPDRLTAWEQLSKTAKQTVADFFDEVIDIRDAEAESEVYDLTDALGGFLAGGGKRSGLSAKKAAQPNDIIASRLRSYLREICVVPRRQPHFKPFVSTEFLIFRPKHGNGNWLLPFLLSDEVQTILRWSQTGNNHPRFHASTVFELPIPNHVLALMDRLSALTADALKTYESGLHAYPEAEAELLERIGWRDLNQKPCELYYTEDVETLTERERIDAEHYQPKYDRLTKRLKKLGAMPLEGLLAMPPSKGTQPDVYLDEGEVIVVKSKNVFGRGIALTSCERTSLRAWADEPARLKENDVVINSTGRGTLGRAGVVHCDDQKIVASVDLLILRTKPDVIDPGYLSLFLNSPAGISQSEQYQTGSSGQLHLYPEHVRQFIIFVPKNGKDRVDLAWQQRLAEKVRQAARAKGAAWKKLEEAKQLVEKAVKEKPALAH